MQWSVPAESPRPIIRRLPISEGGLGESIQRFESSLPSHRLDPNVEAIQRWREAASWERYFHFLEFQRTEAARRSQVAAPEPISFAKSTSAPGPRSGPQKLIVSPPVSDDFSGGLANWATIGDVTVASAEAILGDNNVLLSRMHRTYELGPGVYTVEFDYFSELSADYQSASNFPDTAFASLYFTDSTNTFDIDHNQFAASQKLLDVDYQGAFNVDGAIGASVKGAGWDHFTGTFTSSNTYAVLAFELNDLNEQNNDSQLRVDNVMIVPEPRALSLLALAAFALALPGVRRRRAAALALVCAFVRVADAQTEGPRDVGAMCLVTTTNERSSLNRQTGELTTTLNAAIHNLGNRTILPPFHVVVNLSTGPVTVVGAAGGTNVPPYNRHYLDLSGTLSDGSFDPGERLNLALTFKRSREVQFNYALVPYGILQEEHPPVLLVQPTACTVSEGGTLAIAAHATDADPGDTVTLSAGPAISNLSFAATNGNPANATLLFAPDYDQQGVYSVMVKARDSKGYEDLETVQITVSNVNRAPVVSPLPGQTVPEGGFLAVPLGITDPDGDVLSITPVGMPTNAVLIPEAPTFFWTPNFEQAGPYLVRFIACDSAICRTQSLNVSVVDVPAAPTGDTNAFALNVDPLASPTLQQRLRVTGNVNGSTNGPAPAPIHSAIINSVIPSTGVQGITTNITLSGPAAGLFAVHFAQGASVPQFGEGIAVNSVTVPNATQLVANITIADAAALGPRAPSVTTEDEFAAAVVAFTVQKGVSSLGGRIVDSDTTNGVAGAIVSIEGTGLTTTTASDGTFTLAGIPPGTHVLIINSPNHELVRVSVDGDDPHLHDLGAIPTSATTFDPNAPASVSLLSILGRGLSAFESTDREATKKVIRDALLLAGGSEAGVVDELGNQLNPLVPGYGMMSTLPDGIRLLADRTERGESISLAETLFAFSFGFEWTNGAPLTLSQWLDGLQQGVNRAWADPTNPSNQLPILIFNPGRNLSALPPQLGPDTRLSPAQNYLFVMSMASHMATATNFLGARLSPRGESRLAAGAVPRGFSFFPSAYADPPPTNAAAERKWTSYWRGFSASKNNFMAMQLNSAVDQFANLTGLMMIMGASGDLAVTTLGLPIIGALEVNLAATFVSFELAQRVRPRSCGRRWSKGRTAHRGCG